MAEHHTQRVLIFLPILNVPAGHTTLDSGLGNSCANLGNQTRVNRFRDEVVATERQIIHLIDIVYHIGDGLFSQIGNGECGSHFHLLVDGRGMHVEGSTEDIGEADDVVNLVGIVGTACCHQHIRTACHCVLVRDFGNGVGQRKHDGVIGHRANHILCDHITLRQTDEDIGATHRLLQRVHIAAVGGKEALLLRELLAVAGDHAFRVEHHHILLAGTQGTIELRAGDSGSTGSVHHNLHIGEILASHFQGVLQACCRDDGGAMLVVVHHGNIERSLQAFLNIEALRRLDVLEVDAAECGSDALNGLAELLGVFLIDFDIEDIDAAIDFEQQTLTLHHGLSTQRTNIAKSQHGRTIRDNGHEVAFVRVLIGSIAVALNLQAGIGHTWRISQRQICLCTIGFRGFHLNLTGPRTYMIGQSSFFRDLYHTLYSFKFLVSIYQSNVRLSRMSKHQQQFVCLLSCKITKKL